MSGMAIGLIAGVCCYLAVTKVKARFGYDDSLDAFGVHGVGGTLGAILTGVFAHSAINQPFKDSAGKALPVGLIEGNVGQVINQIIATAASWTMAIIGTLIILWVVDKLVGLRMSEEDERQGIDITQHGEEGYNLI
jgi:Amt family ammonium transporter